MRTTVVKMSEIAANGGRLDAAFYIEKHAREARALACTEDYDQTNAICDECSFRQRDACEALALESA